MVPEGRLFGVAIRAAIGVATPVHWGAPCRTWQSPAHTVCWVLTLSLLRADRPGVCRSLADPRVSLAGTDSVERQTDWNNIPTQVEPGEPGTRSPEAREEKRLDLPERKRPWGRACSSRLVWGLIGATSQWAHPQLYFTNIQAGTHAVKMRGDGVGETKGERRCPMRGTRVRVCEMGGKACPSVPGSTTPSGGRPAGQCATSHSQSGDSGVVALCGGRAERTARPSSRGVQPEARRPPGGL